MATAEDTLEQSKAAASSTPLQQAIERRSAEETTGLRPQVQAKLIQAQTQPRTALPAAQAAPSRASQATSSAIAQAIRSEEHTSELQSPCNLVCRLLLEKKNNLHNNL